MAVELKVALENWHLTFLNVRFYLSFDIKMIITLTKHFGTKHKDLQCCYVCHNIMLQNI